MVDIVTRAGKGSPLTNNEVDANFTNLAEVSGVTGEPMGHEDRTTSTISFNASTRTFTIAPVNTSFTVWCKGKKVVVSSAQTVTIPNTSGMHSIYYDANGTLSSKLGYFTFSEEAPTAYVYWNATTGAAPYFGDERHGVVLDWQTHEYLHRTRGAALASGFGASGYTLGGNGTSNAHAQLTLEGGTFFDEDMRIIVTATNTPTAGTWEQDLLSPARIPVLYLSGTGWVIDAPTDYPLKQGTARPQYNALSGGVWSTADVANNKYATSWILATNNLTYPVIAIIGQAESDLQSAAEAVDFTSLQLPGFPSVEFRPLYRLVFQCADSFSNAVKASLVSITDIRSIAAAGVAASLITDHGNLSGLSDDDHPQYLSVDTVRGTLTAAVKASFLPSQAGNAGKFLTTDATSTSWAALTSGNITTALGFTPYNATNPAGYITGITSSDVTTALGFTPYNATNPSGFVTAAGARGAISVTGSGSYDSATGVITVTGGVTSFNTRTGAITLSSADVTTALGFTPYNSTNPNGYLTGITSTQVTTALGYTPYNSSNPSGYITGITSGMVTTALGFTPYNNSNPSGYITSSALSGYLTSASAASTYLPLAGGTLTGSLVINTGTGSADYNDLWLGGADGWSSNESHGINTYYDTLASPKIFTRLDSLFSGGSAVMRWKNFYYSGLQTSTVMTLTATSATTAALNVTGAITQAGNQVLHAGNYNSYAPTLTGTGASGTWGINITGNAATVTNGLYKTGTNIIPAAVVLNTTADNWMWQWASSGINDWYLGPTTANFGIGGSRLAISSSGSSPNAELSIERGSTRLLEILQANLQYKSNVVLHAGNYNSYSPTLTGGGASGTWAINITGSAATATDSTKLPLAGGTMTGLITGGLSAGSYGINMAANDNYVAMRVISNNNTSGTFSDGMYIGYQNGNSGVTRIFGGGASSGGIIVNGSGVNNVTIAGNIALNAGNYTSYSPTLTGSGASGTWGINITGNAATATTAANYLPLSGGTLTGSLTISAGSSTQLTVRGTEADIWLNSTGPDATWRILGSTGSNTHRFRIYDHTNSAERFFITGNGNVSAQIDMRAPIFYDSDDTSRYVNPNGTTNIGAWTSNSTANIQTGSGGSVYQQIENTDAAGEYAYLRLTASGAGNGYLIKNRATGNSVSNQSLYLWNDPGPIEFIPNGNAALRTTLSTGGILTVATDVRAPIFYDSNNTEGYANFGSGIVRVYAASGGQGGFTVADTGGYLTYRITTNNSTDGWGWRFTTQEANTTGFNTYFSVGYDSGIAQVSGSAPSFRAPIFYDSDNTAYYLNAASTSNVNAVNFNGILAWSDGAYALGSPSYGFRFNNTANTINAFIVNNSGDTTSHSSSRAPIFYDSNNTNFYLNPEAVSSLYGVAIRGDQSPTDSINQIFFWGAGDTTTSAIGFKLNGGEFPNPTGAGDGYNTYFTMDTPGRGWVFREGVGGSNFNAAVTSGWILNNGIWQANASMRSPVFYDSNDTGYYYDGSGLTNINRFQTNQSTATINLANAAIRIENPSTQSSIYFSFSGTARASLRVDSGGSYVMNSANNDFYFNNDFGGSTQRFYSVGTQFASATSNYLTGTGSLRAPIFYDSDNTGYYFDGASTSTLNNVSIASNVGIGVAPGSTANGARMELRGTGVWDAAFNWTNTGSGGRTWTVFSTNDSFGQGGGRFLLYNTTGGSNGFAVDSSNNLTVGGNVTAYGSPSDRRLKHNIREIPTAIAKVLALKPVYYTWNEDTDQHIIAGMTDDMGFIAQDVEEVEPLLVRAGTDGMLGLRERGIIALLTKSFQEQNQEVSDLRNRVAHLESLISKLIGD
jgi:hypothetical protein